MVEIKWGDLFGCRSQRLAHFIGEVLDKMLNGSAGIGRRSGGGCRGHKLGLMVVGCMAVMAMVMSRRLGMVRRLEKVLEQIGNEGQ